LPLEPESGVDTNAESGFVQSGLVSLRGLVRLGRVTGYGLVYGDSFTSRAAVAQVDSHVAEWRNASAARRGFRLGVSFVLADRGLSRFGVPTTVASAAGPAVGTKHGLFLETLRFGHKRRIFFADERAVESRYTLAVEASGSDQRAVKRLAEVLIGRLDKRVRLALSGHLHGKPVQLPRARKPGPPAHGPAPSSLVLKASGPLKVKEARYLKNAFVSSYRVEMFSRIAELIQIVDLAANSTTARYWAAEYLLIQTHAGGYRVPQSQLRARPLHLPRVGDHATGELIRVRLGHGRLDYAANIALRHGPWMDYLIAIRQSPIPTSQILAIAQAAARRLDHGLKG
jgi:hypothetical protein